MIFYIKDTCAGFSEYQIIVAISVLLSEEALIGGLSMRISFCTPDSDMKR